MNNEHDSITKEPAHLMREVTNTVGDRSRPLQFTFDLVAY